MVVSCATSTFRPTRVRQCTGHNLSTTASSSAARSRYAQKIIPANVLRLGQLMVANTDISALGPVRDSRLYSFPPLSQLELPDGSKTICKPGEVIVQRGTDHAWNNLTPATENNGWAREFCWERFPRIHVSRLTRGVTRCDHLQAWSTSSWPRDRS